jgi:3-methyladenine DNA glycosylase AlkD
MICHFFFNQQQMLQQIVSELERIRVAERAPAMEAYMKNRFVFLGVAAGPRKNVLTLFKKEWMQLTDSARWDFIAECWQHEARELQYIAIDALLSDYKKRLAASDLPKIEFLLTQKPWWDTIDLLVSHVVGHYAKNFPQEFKITAAEWESTSNFWLHRSLLIFQLKYKQQTDLVLLQYYISRFKWNKEFFVQKAIGWALREVSKWNPEWVREVVASENLQGLAKREALKYVAAA